MSIDRIDPTSKSMRRSKIGKYDIQSAKYPQNGENEHFVRFYVNLDDESRLIRDSKVTTVGIPDRTDQNRLSRGNFSQSRVDTAGGVAGAGLGVALAQQIARAPIDSIIGGNFDKSSGKYSQSKSSAFASSWVGKGVAAGAGAAIGVAAVNVLDVTKTLKRIGASITLYTPDNIQADYSMEWGQNDSQIADLLAADRGGELIQNIGDVTKNGFKNGVGAKLLRVLATNASKDVSMITRTSKNPKKDFLFRDVRNRSFGFGYTFAPKSPEEAEEVARIIYMFKLFSHPELIEGYDNFLYLYPAEWDIVYGLGNPPEINGNEMESLESNPFLHKISSCFLESVQINYAPHGSFQTLRMGEPTMCTMALKFTEFEALHQGRIEQGY